MKSLYLIIGVLSLVACTPESKNNNSDSTSETNTNTESTAIEGFDFIDFTIEITEDNYLDIPSIERENFPTYSLMSADTKTTTKYINRIKYIDYLSQCEFSGTRLEYHRYNQELLPFERGVEISNCVTSEGKYNSSIRFNLFDNTNSGYYKNNSTDSHYDFSALSLYPYNLSANITSSKGTLGKLFNKIDGTTYLGKNNSSLNIKYGIKKIRDSIYCEIFSEDQYLINNSILISEENDIINFCLDKTTYSDIKKLDYDTLNYTVNFESDTDDFEILAISNNLESNLNVKLIGDTNISLARKPKSLNYKEIDSVANYINNQIIPAGEYTLSITENNSTNSPTINIDILAPDSLVSFNVNNTQNKPLIHSQYDISFDDQNFQADINHYFELELTEKNTYILELQSELLIHYKLFNERGIQMSSEVYLGGNSELVPGKYYLKFHTYGTSIESNYKITIKSSAEAISFNKIAQLPEIHSSYSNKGFTIDSFPDSSDYDVIIAANNYKQINEFIKDYDSMEYWFSPFIGGEFVSREITVLNNIETIVNLFNCPISGSYKTFENELGKTIQTNDCFNSNGEVQFISQLLDSSALIKTSVSFYNSENNFISFDHTSSYIGHEIYVKSSPFGEFLYRGYYTSKSTLYGMDNSFVYITDLNEHIVDNCILETNYLIRLNSYTSYEENFYTNNQCVINPHHEGKRKWIDPDKKIVYQLDINQNNTNLIGFINTGHRVVSEAKIFDDSGNELGSYNTADFEQFEFLIDSGTFYIEITNLYGYSREIPELFFQINAEDSNLTFIEER
ncbi:MAG: hypothetical protein HRU38_21585 [Saccharospirillaceae bacterium]|nr:hypothetical protein [Pseudomonadales bacterium]NRB81222.1 hypothetical protein [Saccharospirillaceae bacterium]